jgi:hypothetical protein
MTPRRRQHLDLAASATKWLGIVGAVILLFKQMNEVRTSNQVLAGSVATVVTDQGNAAMDVKQWRAKMERRVKALEGKKSEQGYNIAAPSTSVQAPPTPGLVQVVAAPFRWAGRFLFGG